MASSASSFSKKFWENIKFIPLQLKIFAFDACEYLKVVFRYYKVWPFARADFSLLAKGFVENPFKVARFYAEREGHGDLSSYTYGETPLTTFAEIAKEAHLGPKSTLIECGAGRGRVALFAHYILGCKVIAYEMVPEFVNRLKRLTKGVAGIEVIEGDYFTADFAKADAIFLYGTTLSDEEITKLGKQLEKAKKGTLFISVSWYLNETLGTPSFPILKVMQGTFPWGKTNIYIQAKEN